MAELLAKLSRRKSIVESGGVTWESAPTPAASAESMVSPAVALAEVQRPGSAALKAAGSPANSPTALRVTAPRAASNGDFQAAINRRKLLVASDGQCFENAPTTNKTDFAHGMDFYASLPTPARAASRKPGQETCVETAKDAHLAPSEQVDSTAELQEVPAAKADLPEQPKQLQDAQIADQQTVLESVTRKEIGVDVVQESQSKLNERLLELANKAKGLRRDVEASIARSETVAASFSVRGNRVTWWAPVSAATVGGLESPSFEMGNIGPITLCFSAPDVDAESDVKCKLSLNGPWPRRQRIWVALFVGQQLEKPREWVGEDISMEFQGSHGRGPRALCGVIFHLADTPTSPTSSTSLGHIIEQAAATQAEA